MKSQVQPDPNIKKQEGEKQKQKQGYKSLQTQQKQQELMDQQQLKFEIELIKKALLSSKTLDQAISTIEQLQLELKDEVQLILLARMDLQMGLGKIAAQCGHATLHAFKNARTLSQQKLNYAPVFIEWLERGQKQVIYRVKDEQQLFKVLDECRKLGASTTYIRDAGRTQVAAGSSTVGVIGPNYSAIFRPIIQKLKIL